MNKFEHKPTSPFWRLATALSILLLATLQAHAANIFESNSSKSLFCTQISIGNGLSQSSAQSIVRDRIGCLWVGTKYGLNRYDYQEIKTYFCEDNNPNTIPHNNILQVFEDSEGTIWAICQNGVASFDAISNSFTRLLIDGKPINVRSHLVQPDGVWLGGAGVLYHYSYADGKTSQLKLKGGTNVYITGIYPTRGKKAIISTRWDGLWTIDMATGASKRLTYEVGKEVTMAMIDSRNRLWVSVFGNGLQCFSENGEALYHYTTANSNLSNNVILCSEEQDGVLFFGSDGGGVNMIKLSNDSISSILNETKLNTVYSANSVLSLYIDHDKNLWVGTTRGGVVCVQDVNMHTYIGTNADDSYGPNAYPITNLMEDGNNIWISTDGGGLNVFNKITKKFTKFPVTNGHKITSITRFDGNNILLSEFSKGLFLFNKNSHKLSPAGLINHETELSIYNKSLPIDLSNDGKGNIYLYSKQIQIFNLASKQLSSIPYNYDQQQLGMLNCFYSDNSQSYIFSTNHILRLDLKTKSLHMLCSLEKSQPITCAQFDGVNTVFIGTNFGLMSYDIKNKKFTKICDSMIKNVSALIISEDRLWVGADNALFAVTLDGNSVISFGQSDGVETNEFIYKACLATSDGIFMGGVNGLLFIDKATSYNMASIDYSISLALTEIEVDGASCFSEIKNKSIDIAPGHSIISLKVIANERNIFRKKKFRFILHGLSNDQYFESTNRSLVLSMLPAGNYTVSVSCLTQNGVWTEPTHVLTMHVLRPWWQRWWSMLLLLCFISAAIFAIIQYSNAKKKDKEMLRIKEMERNSYEKKVKFLINVNHELRTPLTLIYAPLKRIIGNMKQEHLSDKLSQDLSSIYKQSKKMRNVINMILDLRRLETGHTDLHIANININEWVAEIASDFRNEFSNKNIAIAVNQCSELSSVPCDKDKCEIIISNFLMNALKHSPANSTVTVTTELAGDYARIAVCDEGIGLDNVDIDKLFERFYQGQESTSGSGIGLNYSKALVELQNGHIGAFTNHQGGATFWFELPINPQIAVADTTAERTDFLEERNHSFDTHTIINSDEKADLSNMTILVADDDADMCQFTASVFTECNARVIKAYNGNEALVLAKNAIPDLIVSDVMMPKINGFDLCHMLKNSDSLKHVPVILLTARVTTDLSSTSYRLGADAYLPKPFDPDDLLAISVNLIRNRHIIRNRYIDSPATTRSKQTETLSNADDDFIVKIKGIIRDNIGNTDFSVDTVVEKMLISRASLYSKVKELTGESIGELIASYRYEVATKKLTETDTPISEIASSLGFSSQRYFSTAFKNKYGESPSDYRKTHSKKAEPRQ